MLQQTETVLENRMLPETRYTGSQIVIPTYMKYLKQTNARLMTSDIVGIWAGRVSISGYIISLWGDENCSNDPHRVFVNILRPAELEA